jgi:uncharacterized protein YbaA (DUF1428 family)
MLRAQLCQERLSAGCRAATLPVDGKRMFWGGFKTLLEL